MSDTGNTWIHFIGGHYTAQGFIMEAKEIGVSRKASPQAARRMAWGDRVILLKCLDRAERRALVLGEFVIRRITLSEDIAEEVGAALVAEGRAVFQGGGDGQIVKRACGSYVACGTWVVDAEVEEIVDLAAKASKEKGVKPWVLVAGPLTKAYHPPHVWEDGPAFHRTFTLAEHDLILIPGAHGGGKAWIEDVKQGEGADRSTVLAVKDYQKRKYAARRDVYKQGTLF